VLGIAEHDRELRKLRGELIRDDVPLCAWIVSQELVYELSCLNR